jgi:hypothetical protein
MVIYKLMGLCLGVVIASTASATTKGYKATEEFYKPLGTRIMLLDHTLKQAGFKPQLKRANGNFLMLVDQIYTRGDTKILFKYGLKLNDQKNNQDIAVKDGYVFHGEIYSLPFAAWTNAKNKAELKQIKKLFEDRGSEDKSKRSVASTEAALCCTEDSQATVVGVLNQNAVMSQLVMSSKECLINGIHNLSERIEGLPEKFKNGVKSLLENPKAYWDKAIALVSEVEEFAKNIGAHLSSLIDLLTGLSADTLKSLACSLGGELAAEFMLGLGIGGGVKLTKAFMELITKLTKLKPLIESVNKVSGADQKLIFSTALKCGVR